MRRVEEFIKHSETEQAQALRAALSEVLATASGRLLYRWIEDIGRVWDAAPGDADERTAWIGARALALHILRTARAVDLANCQKAERERQESDARHEDALRKIEASETTSPIDRLMEQIKSPNPT